MSLRFTALPNFPDASKKLHSFWTVGAIFFISICILIFRLHSIAEPLERDLTSYAYFAHRLIQGDALYTSLPDNKPPGIYIINIVAQMLWGYEQVSIVGMGIVFSIISLIFLYLLLSRMVDREMALMGAAIWALASNAVSLQANQPNIEVYLNAFTLMGLWAFVLWLETDRLRYILLCGAFIATASFFKMIVIFPAAAMCFCVLFPLPSRAYLKWTVRRIKIFSLLLFPTLLLWAGAFAYFGLKGRFFDLWESIFVFNMYYSGRNHLNAAAFLSSPEKLIYPHFNEIWILVILSLIWFMAGRSQYGPVKRLFLILLFFGFCLEVASPGQFFPHYYQLLLPIFCILPTLLFSSLFAWANGSRSQLARPAVFGLLVFTIGCLGYYQYRYLQMTPAEISKKKYGSEFLGSWGLAHYVNSITLPSDKIYEWGDESGIYFYSKRDSVTGTILLLPINCGSPEYRKRRLRSLLQDVQSAVPKLFIYNTSYGNEALESYWSGFLRERYEAPQKIGPYLLFRAIQPAKP